MGQLDNYRSSLDYREILRILQKASALQENFLWQSSMIGKNIIPIHHFEIDFVTREVVVFFDSGKFKIDSESPLYVKLDYRTSVFKVTAFRQGQHTVHFSFPKEIKTQELRTFPRHQFLPDIEHLVGIKASTSSSREQGNELKVRVLDISQFGIGLLVSEQNRSFLKNNRILWITSLGEHSLEYPILSEVVYINSEIDSKFLARKQKELKVGLRISGAFPHHIYQNFIN